MIFPDRTGLQVDVGKCIKFVQYDIDVVGTDARRNDGDPFFSDPACTGNELPVLLPVFDMVEMPADLFYPVRVPDGDDGVRKLLRSKVKMLDRSACVDDQF